MAELGHRLGKGTDNEPVNLANPVRQLPNGLEWKIPEDFGEGQIRYTAFEDRSPEVKVESTRGPIYGLLSDPTLRQIVEFAAAARETAGESEHTKNLNELAYERILKAYEELNELETRHFGFNISRHREAMNGDSFD